MFFSHNTFNNLPNNHTALVLYADRLDISKIDMQILSVEFTLVPKPIDSKHIDYKNIDSKHIDYKPVESEHIDSKHIDYQPVESELVASGTSRVRTNRL